MDSSRDNNIAGDLANQELAKAFASLFRGRNDAWGGLPATCNHEPLTLAHYRRHLRGEVSLGVYPLLNEGTCFWGATDFDQPANAQWHDGPDDAIPALRLMESMAYYGANHGLSLERTKSKGWRIWIFFSAPVPARHVRRLFHHALRRAGLPLFVEIFPKQDFLSAPTPENPNPVGNYVHLPYFGGGPSGPRSGRVFVDPATLAPIPLGDLLRNLRVFPADALPLVLENLPEQEAKEVQRNAPEEIVAMLRRPLTVGERRPTLVKLTGYLRCRGIGEEVAVALLRPWAQRMFTEPLTAEEIERHIRGIYHRYGMQERKPKSKSWHAEVTL